MKHAIFATLVVAGGLTLSAQTPPAPRPQAPTPSPSTPSRSDDKDKIVTVAGCLKAWDATTPVAKYVLTNVEEDPATVPTETKPAAGAVSAMSKQYVLVADSSVNLSPHVNHKVRVTGKITPAMEHSAAPTTRPADPATPTETPRTSTDRTGTDKMWSTLTVSSLTMVSATCPGATD